MIEIEQSQMWSIQSCNILNRSNKNGIIMSKVNVYGSKIYNKFQIIALKFNWDHSEWKSSSKVTMLNVSF